MLETISNVLDLFLDELLLFLLNYEFLFPVECECQIVDVLDELLSNVFKPFESTCEEEKCFDIIIASLSYCSL